MWQSDVPFNDSFHASNTSGGINFWLITSFSCNRLRQGITLGQPTIGAKIITHTTFIVGEFILQLHTHQIHNFNCQGINLCNVCISLLSGYLASKSIISERRLHTTIMLGELIFNYTHTRNTTIIVEDLIVQWFPLPWYSFRVIGGGYCPCYYIQFL